MCNVQAAVAVSARDILCFNQMQRCEGLASECAQQQSKMHIQSVF